MTQRKTVVILLDRLISERHQQLVRYAVGMTKNLAIAEEITQEAYRKALLNWRAYDRRFAFAAWCVGIIRNLCIDRYRGETAHLVSLDRLVPCNGDGLRPFSEVLPSREIPVLDLMVREEEKAAARCAYASLSTGQRDVVRLLAENGHRYRDVADELGVPVGTVRSRLHRARKYARRRYL